MATNLEHIGEIVGPVLDQIERKRNLAMKHQRVIEIAYAVQALVEVVDSRRGSLSEPNCYAACRQQVREWLRVVEPEYLLGHEEVAAFFLSEPRGSVRDRQNDVVEFA